MACYGVNLLTLDETCIDSSLVTLEGCRSQLAAEGYQFTCYSPYPFNHCGQNNPNFDRFCNGTKPDDHRQALLDRRGIPCCSTGLCGGHIDNMWDCETRQRTKNPTHCWARPQTCRGQGGELSAGSSASGLFSVGETETGPGGTYIAWNVHPSCKTTRDGESEKICDYHLFRRASDSDHPSGYSCPTVARFPDQNCLQPVDPNNPTSGRLGCADLCALGSCCRKHPTLEFTSTGCTVIGFAPVCGPSDSDSCQELGSDTSPTEIPGLTPPEMIGICNYTIVQATLVGGVPGIYIFGTSCGQFDDSARGYFTNCFGDYSGWTCSWKCGNVLGCPAPYDVVCKRNTETDYQSVNCNARDPGCGSIGPSFGLQCCACGEAIFATDEYDCFRQGGVTADSLEDCSTVEQFGDVPCLEVSVGFADRNPELTGGDDFWGRLPPSAGIYQPATDKRIELVRITDYAPGETSCRIYYGTIVETVEHPGRYTAMFCEVRDRQLRSGSATRFAGVSLDASGRGEYVLQYRTRCS